MFAQKLSTLCKCNFQLLSVMFFFKVNVFPDMKISVDLAFLGILKVFFRHIGFRLKFCLLVCHAMLVLHRKWCELRFASVLT